MIILVLLFLLVQVKILMAITTHVSSNNFDKIIRRGRMVLLIGDNSGTEIIRLRRDNVAVHTRHSDRIVCFISVSNIEHSLEIKVGNYGLYFLIGICVSISFVTVVVNPSFQKFNLKILQYSIVHSLELSESLTLNSQSFLETPNRPSETT
jgi:hypothetical protein